MFVRNVIKKLILQVDSKYMHHRGKNRTGPKMKPCFDVIVAQDAIPIFKDRDASNVLKSREQR